MNTFVKTLIAGMVATIVVTLFMMAAPMMGIPKMSPPKMVATMLGASVAIGWLMHFMIGMIYALAYTYLFRPLIPLNNLYAKGILYGILLMVVAKIMMTVMGAPTPEGSMLLALMGKTIGHMVFGVVVAIIVAKIPNQTEEVS